MPSADLPEITRETRFVADLHWHGSWQRNQIPLPFPISTAVEEQPVHVTPAGTVIGGFGAFADELQRRTEKLQCIVYHIPEEEALRWVLKNCVPVAGLNKYCRVVLALDYKPQFKEMAKRNQRVGRKAEGSVGLPKGSNIDCREKIAGLAAVSGRTVDKVHHLQSNAPVEVLGMLLASGASIEQAFLWIKRDEHERGSFSSFLIQRDIHRTVSSLHRKVRKGQPVLIRKQQVKELGELLILSATVPDDCGASFMMDLDSELLARLRQILRCLPAKREAAA
jgi:hypothetical protein